MMLSLQSGNYSSLFTRLETIEKRQISYEIKTDSKIESVLSALEDKNKKPTQGVFHNGQINVMLNSKFLIFNEKKVA